MPIYEYRCEDCGHEVEKLQRITDAPLRDCPACAKPALRRLVSAAGFRLKGAGWYETDFKQGAKRNLHDSGNDKGGATKSDAAGAATKTETKQAAGDTSGSAPATN